MKKKFWVVFFSLFLVLAFSLTAMATNAKKYAVLRPGNPGHQSDAIFMTADELNSPNLGQMIQKRFAKLSKAEGIIDTLKHTFSGVNFGFADGDTMAAFFRPPAGCIVKSVIIQFQKWSSQLTSAFNLSIYNSNYHATEIPADKLYGNFSPINLGWWDASGNWVPQVPYSFYPLGDLLWGDFPISLDPNKDVQTIETPMIYLGYEPDVGRNDFMIVGRPVKGSGQDYTGIPSGAVGGNPLYLGFKCYHTGRIGETTTPSWWIREYGWTIWVVVEFYENTKPTIESIAQLPNTYKTGPFTVTSMIKDIDANDANQAGVAEAYLHYSTNATTWDSVKMTGPATGGEFSADIPSVPPDSWVYYYVTAKDPPGLYSTTADAPKKFWVGKSTDASIFLLNQGGDYGTVFDSVYVSDLKALGYKFDHMFGTVDESVWLPQYTTWIVPAGGRSLPTLKDTLADNKFKDFLDGGGNLMLWADELIGTYYGWPGDTLMTAPGFFHDYLHIAEAFSDAPYDMILDVPGDGFADALTDTIHLTFPASVPNYCDAITPTSDAVKLFTCTPDTFVDRNGANVNGAGLKYDGSYKVVFLPFILGTADENARQTILKSALDFFGVGTGVAENNGTSPFTYELGQNYPNPFNPTTTISYSLAKAGQVNVAVYNLMGQKIADLVNGYKAAGSYRVAWNGRDMAGHNVASGVYFYKIKAGDFTMTKKMVLMR
ncbi:MAG: T9SS type A sorting domain-containing protein [Calditrichaeota bacterium]|nr:T9SS type A sorting domain-containing protein [Calditrichota bacterium]